MTASRPDFDAATAADATSNIGALARRLAELAEAAAVDPTPANQAAESRAWEELQDAKRRGAPKTDALRTAWHTLTAADLEAEPLPQEYVATPRIPLGKVCQLAATGGTGKTTYTASLAIRRALGLSDLDGSPLRQGETVIVTGEDGALDYQRKFAALRLEMGPAFDSARIAGRVHIEDVSGIPGTELVHSDFGQLVITRVPDDLGRLVKERAPLADLIIIETISRFGAGETNEAHALLVKACEQLVRLTGAAVLLVGHVSQAAARAGLTDQHVGRGGTAGSDNSRSVMAMSHLTAENLAKFAPGAHLSDGDMERYVVLTHPKSMGPKAPPMLLERLANDYGPVFRMANLTVQGTRSMDARFQQLLNVVTKKVAAGLDVTETKLRDLHDDFGLSERAMRRLVDDAIEKGVLRQEKGKVVRGGAHPLLPGRLPTEFDREDE